MNGLQSGNGTAIYNNGNKYVGQFLSGFKHGFGILTGSKGEVFTGNYRRGVREGHGIEVFSNGERYTRRRTRITKKYGSDTSTRRHVSGTRATT